MTGETRKVAMTSLGRENVYEAGVVRGRFLLVAMGGRKEGYKICRKDLVTGEELLFEPAGLKHSLAQDFVVVHSRNTVSLYDFDRQRLIELELREEERRQDIVKVDRLADCWIAVVGHSFVAVLSRVNGRRLWARRLPRTSGTYFGACFHGKRLLLFSDVIDVIADWA